VNNSVFKQNFKTAKLSDDDKLKFLTWAAATGKARPPMVARRTRPSRGMNCVQLSTPMLSVRVRRYGGARPSRHLKTAMPECSLSSQESADCVEGRHVIELARHEDQTSDRVEDRLQFNE